MRNNIYPRKGTLDRGLVLWVGGGADAPVEAALAARGLKSYTQTFQQDVGLPVLSECRGCVVSVAPGHSDEVRDFLQRWARLLADHGVFIYFIGTNANDLTQVTSVATQLLTLRARRQALETLNLFERSDAQAPVDVQQLAEKLRNWEPGPKWRDVQVQTVGDTTVPPEHRFLLCRAFSDCSSLTVAEIKGGYSEAKIYRVFAMQANNAFIRRPLPYFAKVGRRDKIEQEYSNYQHLVIGAVPFNLRPDLDSSRCCLGSALGILVGDFVDRSEPLIAAAVKQRAQPAIYCLFDHAIAAWHSQANEDDEISTGNIISELENEGIRIRNLNAERADAIRELKKGIDPVDQNALIERIRGLSNRPHRVGPAHGDLHGQNVVVRGNDAILLDFYNAKGQLPVLTDLAYLDIQLAFVCREGEHESWRSFIDEIYGQSNLEVPPQAADSGDEWSWLRNSLRQIRMFALAAQQTEHEYKLVVSYLLLRHGTFAPNEEVTETRRRAYAYVVAERLVEELEPEP
jgi:Ternary complex associated domain 9